MNVLACVGGEAQESHVSGRYLVATTWPRINYSIDGVPFRSYVVDDQGRDLSGQDVTLFDTHLADAVEILLGAREWAPEFGWTGRAPILLYSCGDPGCGALVARLTVLETTVEWSDWAWVDYSETIRPMTTLPSFTFDRQQYTGELNRVRRIEEPEPIAVVRVRSNAIFHGAFFTPWRRKPERLLMSHLRALQAEAVKPSIGEADGPYFEFLCELDQAQAWVTGWHSRGGDRSEGMRAAMVETLGLVRQSPFADRLPDVTLEAIDWFLADLRSLAPESSNR